MLLLLCSLITLTALAGCTVPGGDDLRPETAPVHTLSYHALDYSFEGPAEVQAGWTRLRLENHGDEWHLMSLMRLDDGKTADDMWAALNDQQSPPPEWLTEYGAPSGIASGGWTEVTVNLRPGTYVMICFISDANGRPHFDLGMTKELRVVGPEVTSPPNIGADATLDLVEFGFGGQPPQAGDRVLAVRNLGEQDHELLVVRLDPGATGLGWSEALFAMFDPNITDAPAPPGIPVGGTTFIAPGETQYVTVPFESGYRYAYLCYYWDEEQGESHHDLGMLYEFDVA